MNSLEYTFRIIIDQLCFLELTDDAILNPDVAVQQTEQIAAALIEMDTEGKHLFEDVCRLYADESADADRVKAGFIAELPDNLGLRDDEG